MRIFLHAVLGFCACSSSTEPCNADCVDRGFVLSVPDDTKTISLSGACKGNIDPAMVVSGTVFLHPTSAGTCHIEIVLGDGTHRAGDSQVTEHADRCCGGYDGTPVDLTK
jgi:hypothetical protein